MICGLSSRRPKTSERTISTPSRSVALLGSRRTTTCQSQTHPMPPCAPEPGRSAQVLSARLGRAGVLNREAARGDEGVCVVEQTTGGDQDALGRSVLTQKASLVVVERLTTEETLEDVVDDVGVSVEL